MDCLHRCDRINGSDLGTILTDFLNDDVARQHSADLVFKLKRFVGEPRIACPNDTIVAETDPKLFLEGPFHIDLRDDAKAATLVPTCRPKAGT